MSNKLCAGTAELIISPPVGTELLEPVGKVSTGIHDDLFCRILLFENKEKEYALVSMDLVGLDSTLVKNLREKIQQKTGLSFRNVMLHCTHTHNSPVTINYLRQNQFTRNRVWEGELGEKIIEAISVARKNLLPVKEIGAGKGEVNIGVNRRLPTEKGVIMSPNPEGISDPSVEVLNIVREKGTPIILFSHAAHPVSVHRASTLVTADYPGYAVRTIRSLLGEDLFPIFFQGCCGNINSNPLASGFDEAERLGRILGGETVKIVRKMQNYSNKVTLKSYYKEVDLPLEDPPSPKEAENILHEVEEGVGVPARFGKFHRQEMLLWAKELVKLAHEGNKDYSMPSEIQILVLGDGVILIGLSHELFVDYQLRIKKHSSVSYTFVFGYTNVVSGYIPVPSDFSLGGYEVSEAPKWYGVLSPKLDAGEVLFGNVIDMLVQAKENGGK